MKYCFILLLSLLLITLESAAQISYTPTEDVFSNPERGFYHHTEAHSNNYEILSSQTLANYRTNENITQILRVFYLENFKTGPISSEYLNNVRKDFQAVRAAGIKIIIRFAYTTNSTAPYGDATPETVLLHISQLKPIIQENADVIAVWQAGFIGAWGEWYYTDYFAHGAGQVHDDDWANRKKVVEAILNALPTDRYVQVRTPGYKMTMYDTESPISTESAFSGTDYSRIGHHNDCFVASSSDYGTYVQPSIEKPYLEKETLFLPMGGETCNVAPPYSDCEFSQSELQRFHWSYLNIDYNRQVLGVWEDQGCFDEVELKLGYRYQLIEGSFTSQSKPGGTFEFDLKLLNEGYSNPYNHRKVEIILRNKETKTSYVFRPSENIKLWPLGEYFNITFSAGIPTNFESGSYDLYLNLPDAYPTLAEKPAYSIRMANENTWDADLGYNLLKSDISIKSGNTSIDFMGSSYFEPKESANIIEVPNSSEIKGSEGSDKNMIYWLRTADFTRVIERSNDGVDFEIIAAIPSELDYYLDQNLTTGSTFYYRYYLQNESGRTTGSSSIALTTKATEFTVITTDGSNEDWLAIPPFASLLDGTQETYSWVYFDSQKMNALIEGNTTGFELYFNIDNDLNTGFSESESVLKGMDFKTDGTTLYQFDDTWKSISSDLNTATSGQFTEISISLEALFNGNDNTVIPVLGITGSDALLSSSDGTPVNIFRVLPPDVPQNFGVRKSGDLPKSRLVVFWDKCESCVGYNLERSENNQDFELVDSYAASTTLVRDDNLKDETTYYYRVASYNSIGPSAYSTTVSESTGEIIINGIFNVLKAFPNPTSDVITFLETYESIKVYDMSGKLGLKTKNSDHIDLSSLRPSIYLIHVKKGNETQQIKVIRQ